MLEHRCFECSPLATTCQDLRWTVSLLEKGCPSVLEFLEEIELKDTLCFPMCCNAHLVNSRGSVPCSFELSSQLCEGSLLLVDPRMASVFNSFALVCLPVFGTLARTG